MTSFKLVYRIGDEFFTTSDNMYGLEKDLIFINSKEDSEIIAIETEEELNLIDSFGITSEYNDKLKSCPFCKGVVYLTHVEFNDGDIWYNPNCSECNCGWKENYETKEEAIDAWNKRR